MGSSVIVVSLGRVAVVLLAKGLLLARLGKKEGYAAVQNDPPVQDPVKAQEPLATEEIDQPVQRMIQANHVASDHEKSHE